ncbi:hypothetical protein CHELA40_12171 [Chelatococcus asaccharovorans]|nr:hypothetical protein CHELA40_12171 [Chelatococcus asaccharovorans]CAH1683307.1 hypothetical protein CHELA17_63434 [Chelatococcus asaccharovorans]
MREVVTHTLFDTDSLYTSPYT